MLRSDNDCTRSKKSGEQPHTQLKSGQVTYDLLTNISETEKTDIIQTFPGINPSIFHKITEGKYAGYYKATLGIGQFSKTSFARKIDGPKTTYVAIKKMIRPLSCALISKKNPDEIPTLDPGEEQSHATKLNGVRAEIRLHQQLSQLSLQHSIIIEDQLEAINSYGIPQIYQIMPLIEHNGETYLKKITYAQLSNDNHLALFNHFAIDLIQAVQELHENNIYHRDLKPDNILISHAGKVYITDFGLARYFPKNKLGAALSISYASYLPYILPYRHISSSGLSFSDEGKTTADIKAPPPTTHDDCDIALTIKPDPYAHVAALSALQDAWSMSLILIQYWSKKASDYLNTDLFTPSAKGFFSKKTKEEIYTYYEAVIQNLFSSTNGLLQTMPSPFKNLCHTILLAGLNTLTRPEEAKKFSLLTLLQSKRINLKTLSGKNESITALCSYISTICVEKEKLLAALKKALALIETSELDINEKTQMAQHIQDKMELISAGNFTIQAPIKLTLTVGTLFRQNSNSALRPDKASILIQAVSILLNKNDIKLINALQLPTTKSSTNPSAYI